jgi:ElaB/YqjD/DUF883 family membrane-anchored ribosome-binding protein
MVAAQESKMPKMSDGIAGNAQDVSDDVKAFGRDVLKLANALSDEAKTRVGDIGETATHQAKAAYTNVRTQIGANPAIALGVAVGAGVLVGFLLKGRH